MEEWLRIGANLASILTSIIAAGASIVYWANKRSRRTRLESYLRAKKEKSPDEPFSATRLGDRRAGTRPHCFALAGA
jgi:hypothetical protein